MVTTSLPRLTISRLSFGPMKQTVLKANDACFIGPNESREIVNRGNDIVTMLVAVSTPQK